MTYIEKTPPKFNTDHSTAGVAGKSFAEMMAADAFGPRYVRPPDRNFRDRGPPNWEHLGAVANRVLGKTASRMALKDVLQSPNQGEAANVK